MGDYKPKPKVTKVKKKPKKTKVKRIKGKS
jgi:hypothetical protein